VDEIESLGRYLKREREFKNISLKEVAKNTRVKEHFLKAIEEDQHHLLPSRTYVKGFLLAYAKYIGLDPNDVLHRYENFLVRELIVPKEIPFKKKIFWNTKQTWIIVVVVIVSLIASYFLYPSKPTNQSVSVKPEPEETLSPSPPEIVEVTPITEKKPFSLQLKAVEKTWIRIQVNAEPEKEMIFKPGEEGSYSALDRIYLLVGNAGGLDLIFNERPLERFGKSGEVVTLIVTFQGVEKKLLKKPKSP
jgi:cytoskeletal protein RodZ